MSLTRKLVLRKGSKAEYWNLVARGSTLRVTAGRVGGRGKARVKKCKSAEACLREAQRLVRGRLDQGWVDAGEPLAVLEAACARADPLLEKKKFTRALELIDPAIDAAEPIVSRQGGWAARVMGNAYLLRGIAHSALEQPHGAIADFERSAKCGDDDGLLNLLATYEELGQPKRVIARGEKVELAKRDEYFRFWGRNYLLRAYIRAGAAAKALAICRDLLAEWASVPQDRAQDLIDGLLDIEGFGGAPGALAHEIRQSFVAQSRG